MTNAEKFKTAEERQSNFNKFCDQYVRCLHCPLGHSSRLGICRFKWLDLEYKEELKPCPFCGKVPTLKTDLNTYIKPRYYYVECSCGAGFKSAVCESVAVEQWNRRVK